MQIAKGATKDDKQLTVEGMLVHLGGGLWRPDTPENRWDLERVVAKGNTAYGEGAHWIEGARSLTLMDVGAGTAKLPGFRQIAPRYLSHA